MDILGGANLDIIVTHTVAGHYNKDYRQSQVKQLIEIVTKSTADAIVLGGDFNFDPEKNKERSDKEKEETSIWELERVMTNIRPNTEVSKTLHN